MQSQWPIGSITMNKASGGDRIPVQLFKILKDDTVKVLHSICQQTGKNSSGHQTRKGQFSFPKKGNATECSQYHTTARTSHASKVMLKILQARLQQYVNCELPDFKLDLEKAEEPEIQLPTSSGSSKSKRIPEKHLLLLYWLCQSLWLCGSHQTVENYLRD